MVSVSSNVPRISKNLQAVDSKNFQTDDLCGTTRINVEMVPGGSFLTYNIDPVLET